MKPNSIQDAGLRAHEQAIQQETDILRDANIALTENLSLERVLETLLDFLTKLVPCDSANVMLLNGDSKFRVSALRRYEGFQDIEVTRAISFDLKTNGILQRICETKQTLVVPDTHQDPHWEIVKGADHVRNWMGVPLVSSNRVIGLYSVDKVVPNFFRPEHVRLAETLAARAVSAIRNAQLFEQLQMFSRKLIEAQEEERRRIARELHDQVGQILTAVKMNLHTVQKLCTSSEVGSYVKDNIEAVDEALRLVRDLSVDLMPPLLDDLGLVTALRWYVDRYTLRSGLDVDVVIEMIDDNERFSRDVETACFRIAQEALTNVIRHADASQVIVRLAKDENNLVLSVQDDGVGFDLEQLRKQSSRAVTLGLVGMQERAHAAGGTIEIESGTSNGTVIRLTLPLDCSK